MQHANKKILYLYCYLQRLKVVVTKCNSNTDGLASELRRIRHQNKNMDYLRSFGVRSQMHAVIFLEL